MLEIKYLSHSLKVDAITENRIFLEVDGKGGVYKMGNSFDYIYQIRKTKFNSKYNAYELEQQFETYKDKNDTFNINAHLIYINNIIENTRTV